MAEPSNEERLERLRTVLGDRYVIEREVGSGGMATVYLAQDVRHDRKVALKVLRPELAAVLGADRFVQEIKTTASLQHPHILPLFDSGRAGDKDGGTEFLYYVMPFIEGETLREKLDRETQLGVEEAVRITSEIADALDYAHRHGVIHRDMKPENILLHDGRPLVADFGIALAVSAAAGGRMTETGLSLGTPHYMSPEQATAEKDLTNRSDVYSLGAVLYEMLTGNPPHTGSTVHQIIMKIVTEPAAPVTSYRKSVPPNVAAALAKTLEKIPADRFKSAARFAEALNHPSFRAPTTGIVIGAGIRERRVDRRLTWTLGVCTALALVIAAWGWLGNRPADTPVRRYQMLFPEGEEIGGWALRIAISPDGSSLVYIRDNEEGHKELWLRRREQLHATPIPGTIGAEAPFFSPDGDAVGFFSPRGTLRTVPLDGGPAERRADVLVGSAGGSWGEDGYIYTDGKGESPLARVPTDGGAPEWFTTLDASTGELEHFLPEALPGGTGVLFVVRYADLDRGVDIALADPATGRHRILMPGERALYARSGHLLYVTLGWPYVESGRVIVAQPFDPGNGTVSGEPIVLAENLASGSIGAPNFIVDMSLSNEGTLVYLAASGGSNSSEVVRVERDGTARRVDPTWTDQVGQGIALSPDGGRLALSIAGQIWVRDLTTGAMTKTTFEGGSRPAWSPDGKKVGFVSARKGLVRLAYVRDADGTGPVDFLVRDPRQVHEVEYSSDGQWLVYRTGGGGASDLYALRAGAASEAGDPIPIVTSIYQETSPTLSPDGRWLAYTSLESGQYEVWVRPFPDTDAGRWQISESGGSEPLWSPPGGELFFKSTSGDLMSVEIDDGPVFRHEPPRPLFSADVYRGHPFYHDWDVTPDGEAFFMLRKIRESGPPQPVVIENVFEVLHGGTGR